MPNLKISHLLFPLLRVKLLESFTSENFELSVRLLQFLGDQFFVLLIPLAYCEFFVVFVPMGGTVDRSQLSCELDISTFALFHHAALLDVMVRGLPARFRLHFSDLNYY